MTNYKIKVSFEKVFEVEAENQSIAIDKAEIEALYFIKSAIKDQDTGILRAEQYQEPISWYSQAEELGKDIANYIEDEIKSTVADWQAKNPEKVGLLEENDDSFDIDSEIQEIFDELYQSQDISSRALEYADGYFIYNSSDALVDAMKCINILSEYEETDSGLWEGKEDYWDIINIKATFTLSGAIMHFAEEAIKERIEELLK